MTREQESDRLAELRQVPYMDALTFAMYLEAVIAKHEHRRRVVRPEPEPEVINEEPLYVS